MVDLIGVYSVKGNPDVHLLELSIPVAPQEVDVSKITQKREGVSESDWQEPWDEQFLNEKGNQVIGDWLQAPPKWAKTTRLAFFFHFLEFDLQLSTPFGDLDLKEPTYMPRRLSSIIRYERPD